MNDEAQKESDLNQTPIVVDLDGTLIRTDCFLESLTQAVRNHPIKSLMLLCRFAMGRAYLKHHLARLANLDVSLLPYNTEFLEHLKKQKTLGREIILATASDSSIADQVANHLGIFSRVLASDGRTNLKGKNKLKAIIDSGYASFTYAGNSQSDMDVWKQSKAAIVVSRTMTFVEKVKGVTKVESYFVDDSTSLLSLLFNQIRIRQWVKNILIFIPVVTAHEVFHLPHYGKLALTFLAFGFCASSVYVLNDLFDLGADRAHPTKRNRPFASGNLPLHYCFVSLPTLLIGACICLYFLPKPLTWILLTYLAISNLYTLYFKSIAIIDVFFLATLYILRLIAGHLVTGIPYSPWLLIFSLFIFLSLALLKRYSELIQYKGPRQTAIKNRDYVVDDAVQLGNFGSCSGYLAVLVFLIYISNPVVNVLYEKPFFLWLVAPVFLFWITRIWFLAHRGKIDQDPIMFTLKDKLSYGVGCVVIVLLLLAS